MTAHTLNKFLSVSQPESPSKTHYTLSGERILQISLNGEIWAKMGSMVAYRGAIRFSREGILEHGVGRLLKEAVTGEGLRLMKAMGNGTLYLADAGKKIILLDLRGESLFVNGNDVLAFETRLNWDITLMKRISGILAGGLFNVKLEGTGLIAITTYHDPVALAVTPGQPVITDPNATVAWSGSLTPSLKTDISLKTFIGRGSGESLQMRFEGNGWVVVQPYEEIYVRPGLE